MDNICERCEANANGLIMSMFNTQMICRVCEMKEKVHPKYQDAADRELRELKSGNFDFEGIGLPIDLE